MTLFALLGAALIGVMLGLLGSGGSILTVPVLVYLLDQPERLAIAGSLAIVGGIALVGGIPYARRGQVDWRSVAWFGLPGMAGTWGGAWLAQFVAGGVQLAVFAAVMLAAAWSMFRPTASAPAAAPAPRAFVLLVADGLAVGALTGFVGVGGGFLIVPALVLLGGLPMAVAVGTSLVIIALKSAAGAWKYLELLGRDGLTLDWGLILGFIVVGALGALLGQRYGATLPQATLKRVFAVVLVVMATAILWRTLPGML